MNISNLASFFTSVIGVLLFAVTL